MPPEWAAITDWADELAPYIDQASRMLGVVRYPYMPTDMDRYIHEIAIEMGRGKTFNQASVGVYFGRPGVEAEDPYFGGAGPGAPDVSPAATATTAAGTSSPPTPPAELAWVRARNGG